MNWETNISKTPKIGDMVKVIKVITSDQGITDFYKRYIGEVRKVLDNDTNSPNSFKLELENLSGGQFSFWSKEELLVL